MRAGGLHCRDVSGQHRIHLVSERRKARGRGVLRVAGDGGIRVGVEGVWQRAGDAHDLAAGGPARARYRTQHRRNSGGDSVGVDGRLERVHRVSEVRAEVRGRDIGVVRRVARPSGTEHRRGD